MDLIEKSKTSFWREFISNTRSNVNAPEASFDYPSRQHMSFYSLISTYVQTACVFAVEFHNRLPSKLDLGTVLRAEPRHDLDTVRHDRDGF